MIDCRLTRLTEGHCSLLPIPTPASIFCSWPDLKVKRLLLKSAAQDLISFKVSYSPKVVGNNFICHCSNCSTLKLYILGHSSEKTVQTKIRLHLSSLIRVDTVSLSPASVRHISIYKIVQV